MLCGHWLVDLQGGLRRKRTRGLSAGRIGKRRGRLRIAAVVHAVHCQMTLTRAAVVSALAHRMRRLEAVCRGQDGLSRHESHNQRRHELKKPLHLRENSTRKERQESVILITSRPLLIASRCRRGFDGALLSRVHSSRTRSAVLVIEQRRSGRNCYTRCKSTR
jgi:hypothetical protein